MISAAVGDRIAHPIYGEGTIIKIQDSPNGQICRVLQNSDPDSASRSLFTLTHRGHESN